MKKRKTETLKQTAKRGLLFGIQVITYAALCGFNTHAMESGENIVTGAFDVIYGLIAAVVSSIGTLYLLWGTFEWASSLNVQDGGAQSMAFKRIAGGLIGTIVPQLIPLITSQIGA